MRTAAILAGAALMAALLGAAFLSFADTYSGETCEASSGGPSVCTDTSATLVEENGKWLYGLLVVPIVIAAAVTAAIAYRLPKGFEWSLAGLALVACVIAIFSIGGFFLPAALLLVAACAKDRRGPATS